MFDVDKFLHQKSVYSSIHNKEDNLINLQNYILKIVPIRVWNNYIKGKELLEKDGVIKVNNTIIIDYLYEKTAVLILEPKLKPLKPLELKEYLNNNIEVINSLKNNYISDFHAGNWGKNEKGEYILYDFFYIGTLPKEKAQQQIQEEINTYLNKEKNEENNYLSENNKQDIVNFKKEYPSNDLQINNLINTITNIEKQIKIFNANNQSFDKKFLEITFDHKLVYEDSYFFYKIYNIKQGMKFYLFNEYLKSLNIHLLNNMEIINIFLETKSILIREPRLYLENTELISKLKDEIFSHLPLELKQNIIYIKQCGINKEKQLKILTYLPNLTATYENGLGILYDSMGNKIYEKEIEL